MSNKNEAKMRDSSPADRAPKSVRVASSPDRTAKLDSRPSFRRLPLVGVVAVAFASSYVRAADSEVDLTNLPFEQLVNTEIVTATKLSNQVSQASSAVSIVTADDIRAYGYRTLDEILGGMRGLYMAHTFQYGLLGGRGFGDPGDYAGRITVLIDGQDASDSFYGQSYFGADGVLDVDLIDRVEYIPGPGSVSYGNGAFLGVINVITKKGADFGGAQISQEYGTHNWNKSRLTYGSQLDNGLDFLVSASSYSNDGRDITRDLVTGEQWKAGEELNKRLFLKAAFRGWSVESAWVRRPILWPGSRDRVSDETTLVNLKYDNDIGSGLKFSGGAFWGEYLYDTVYPALNNSNTPDVADEIARGRWWSVNAKFVGTWFDSHTLAFGLEHRNNYQQDYAYKFLISGELLYGVPASHQNSNTSSFYIYDDYEVRPDVQLNFGIRYDRRDDGRESISPRAAVILKPWEGGVLKFSSGAANREPSAMLQSYQLKPRTERVITNEVVWEQQLAPRTRLISSLYRYRIDGQTVWDGEQKIFATGAEVELDHNWDGGSRLKMSYAWQDARNELDHWLFNSPHHNAKLNFTTPLVGEKLRVGVEARFLSQRRQYDNRFAPGYGVADLTFTSSQALPGWQASLSVRNVFNRSYGDVRSMWNSQDPAEPRLFPMDGRNFWLQLSRDFK